MTGKFVAEHNARCIEQDRLLRASLLESYQVAYEVFQRDFPLKAAENESYWAAFESEGVEACRG